MTEAEKDGFQKGNGHVYQQQGKQELEYHRDDPEYVRKNGSNDQWERYHSDKHNKDEK